MSEAEKAKQFARTYVLLAEALQREGVPATQAREDARFAAIVMLQRADAAAAYDPAQGPCSHCGLG